MTFYLQTSDILLLATIFGIMGIAGVMVAEKLKSMRVDIIAEGYRTVAGGFSQSFRKGLPGNAEAFAIGEHQFLVDVAYATTREKWNRWGGNCPVIRYHVEDARPMSNSFQVLTSKSKTKVKPNAQTPDKIDLERHEKPSSGTVNLLIRRKGAAIMIEATKKVAMNPWVAGVCGALVAGAAVYLLLSLTAHPADCIAQAGFYCRLTPIPTNATVVH